MIKIFNNNNYYIKYNLFNYKNSSYYLIKWQPKMKTIVHNHEAQNCYFYLIKGNLKEKLYKKNKFIKTNYYDKILSNGFINDNIGSHSIENINNSLALSIHIYEKY